MNNKIEKYLNFLSKTKFPEDEIAETLMRRAYILNLSYKTTWVQYMREQDKKGFSFEEVEKYINGKWGELN